MYDDIPNLNRCQLQSGRLFQSMSFSFSLNYNTRENILLFFYFFWVQQDIRKIAWCTNIVRDEDDNVIQWLISNTTFNNGMWHVLNGFLFTKLYVNMPYFLLISMGLKNIDFNAWVCDRLMLDDRKVYKINVLCHHYNYWCLKVRIYPSYQEDKLRHFLLLVFFKCS